MMLDKRLLAMILLFAIAVVSACGGETDPAESPQGDDLTQMESSVDTSGLPVLIDLGSNTCVPCRMMVEELEMLDQLTGEDLVVRVIDLNESPDASDEYGVQIIPTQIFISPEGDELFRHQGFISCQDMLAKWNELGYSFEQELHDAQ